MEKGRKNVSDKSSICRALDWPYISKKKEQDTMQLELDNKYDT